MQNERAPGCEPEALNEDEFAVGTEEPRDCYTPPGNSPSTDTLTFPQLFRHRAGPIGQHLFAVIRENGAKSPAEVVAAVGARALGKLTSDHWLEEWQRQELRDLRLALKSDRDLALAYADDCLKREALPDAEKARLKDERGRTYALQAGRERMRGQPVTEKQLALLDRLGITDPPADRLQASELIDALLGERRRGGGR